ncbi:Digestive cysteine proteinase 2 [Tritrichomonas foetus]|uniref:Digestive cysteine proteinase 2 n=1 Tax=Tritrichomonas foetus TaxID=1144522 RepID=A0A1J4J736_9EUKA|nr:Digestive cysteine proteinase 2 [Tritrichomonas foetus]|eukprot:OHS93467.1 Digestive cysteine proteinase 2 [Tritrichomonas foetus]
MLFAFFYALTASKLEITSNDEKSFVSWMRSTNHLFVGQEYHLRFGIWLANARYVKQHNKRNLGFTLAMNKFASMTPSEYNSLLLSKPSQKLVNFHNKGNNEFSSLLAETKTSKKLMINKVHSKKSETESLDWRKKGCVNEVQDMGNCGADWAFSGVAAAEGSNFLAHNILYKFSEQSFIDCDKIDSQGCQGGVAFSIFDFMHSNCDGKAMLANDYPYKGVDGTCQYDQDKAVGSLSDIIGIEFCNEDDLQAKCEQYGPVTSMIDASHASFQLYSYGIYDEPQCKQMGVTLYTTIVGFGVEDGVKFWIVRNSWGASWGENGYIRMVRGQGNQCGEATSACVPVS